MPLTESLVQGICGSLRQNMAQIARCCGLLTDAQLWSRPNEHCNSIANLLLHLDGNVRQWILGGLAGRHIERDRPAEFAARGGVAGADALARLQATVEDACQVIAALDAGALERRHVIQKYNVTGVLAAYHVGEHFSFHTGQIVHITKTILDVDLSLYDAQGRRHAGAAASPWWA
jgi:hypothetical protein